MGGMSYKQAAGLMGIGVVAWGIGVVALRMMGPGGWLGNERTALVYALIVPATLPIVWLGPRLVGLPRRESLAAAAMITTPAALMDGVVVRWFPSVYAPNPAALAQAGATLLWGLGVGLALGAVLTMVAQRQEGKGMTR